MDKTLFKFLLVGVGNTLFSAAVMFGLYNLLHSGYWFSSAIAYILGSILSFFLNKSFTFQNQDSIAKTAPKFILNILICYLLAYGMAKPLVLWAFSSFSAALRDNIAMFLGMCLFTALNYVGQRYFAFQK